MENNSVTAATAALLEGLRQHTQGLLYLSETEAELEPVYFAAAPASGQVAAWAGKPPGEKVETKPLAYFMKPMLQEEAPDAPRFLALQQYLEQHLQDVLVYRVGQRRITVLVLGRDISGGMAGLKTEVVET